MRLFDRFMTIDLLQRFMGVHDLMAMHYQALAKQMGIDEFDQLSQQHLKLVGLYKEMGDEMQKQGRNKKRGWILITVLALMLLVVGNVGAQDVTEEAIPVGATVNGEPVEATVEPLPTEPDPQPGEWRDFIEVFMLYLTQIVIAVVIGGVALAGGAIVVAGNGMPKWARDMTQSAITTGLDRAEQYVKDTPSKADDEMMLQLREMITQLFADMQTVKSAVAPNAVLASLTEEDIRDIRRRAVPGYYAGRDFPVDAEGG